MLNNKIIILLALFTLFSCKHTYTVPVKNKKQKKHMASSKKRDTKKQEVKNTKPAKVVEDTPLEKKKVKPEKVVNSIDSTSILTEKQLEILSVVKDEKLKHVKKHFYSTNEKRHDLFIPYIKNIGGAYLGVGADQNYTFAAAANSKLVFLMDYDRYITRLHKMYIVAVTMSDTIDKFRALFQSEKMDAKFKKEAEKLFSKDDVKRIMGLKSAEKRFFKWWHKKEIQRAKRYKYDTWLSKKEYYDRWRKLVLAKRVIVVGGDLTKAKALMKVSIVLKKLKYHMGLIYFSNAEEYWGGYPKPFRKAIINMPVNDKSLIIRGTFMGGKDQADNLYHYSFQKFDDFKEWMKIKYWISATYLVHLAKKNIKKHFFSRILPPSPEMIKTLTNLIKKVRRERRKARRNKSKK